MLTLISPVRRLISGLLLALALLTLALIPAQARPVAPDDAIVDAIVGVPTYGYRVVNTYPHDAQAFTQGLVYEADDMLYEGTGLYGQSSLRKVDLATGQVLQRADLAPAYFGEGITVWGDEILQLTWREHTGFVYDKDSFRPEATFSYPTEGWGFTNDGESLIMSDGTATLTFLDPDTLQPTHQVQVHDERGPVTMLNELEYVKGEIFANIWQTDRIARIDPETGDVVGWIDLTGLLSPAERAATDVLNGIAYDTAGDRLFVTGKLWPKLFEIELMPPASHLYLSHIR